MSTLACYVWWIVLGALVAWLAAGWIVRPMRGALEAALARAERNGRSADVPAAPADVPPAPPTTVPLAAAAADLAAYRKRIAVLEDQLAALQAPRSAPAARAQAVAMAGATDAIDRGGDHDGVVAELRERVEELERISTAQREHIERMAQEAEAMRRRIVKRDAAIARLQHERSVDAAVAPVPTDGSASAWDHRWRIGLVGLVLALLLLPAFGLGPTAWTRCAAPAGSSAGSDAAAVAPAPAGASTSASTAPSSLAGAPAHGGRDAPSAGAAVPSPNAVAAGATAANPVSSTGTPTGTQTGTPTGTPTGTQTGAPTGAAAPAAAIGDRGADPRGSAASATIPATAAAPSAPVAGAPGTPAPDARVLFAFDSAELRADARAELRRLAEAMRERPGSVAVVAGFHDPSGPAWRNEQLSRQRARAVVRALVQAGVDPARIETAQAVAGPSGEPAREARRAEVRLGRRE